MGYYNYGTVGVFLADKSKVELLKQFFECIEATPCDEFAQGRLEDAIPFADTGLDYLGYSSYFKYFHDWWYIINRLFGRAYVVRGVFFGVTNYDCYQDGIQLFNPFTRNIAFKLRDVDYYGGVNFGNGTPYNLYAHKLELLARAKGIQPSWRYEHDEEAPRDRMYPDPNAQDFCRLCDEYVQFELDEEGCATGWFPLSQQVYHDPKTLDEGLIATAEAKGYHALAALLTGYREGVSHLDEGDVEFVPSEAGTSIDRLLSLSCREDGATHCKSLGYDPKEFVIKDGVLLKYLGNGGDVVIPAGVTSIEPFAFGDCSGPISLYLPYGITSICPWTFKDCSSLTFIAIPDGVTYIDERAFEGCSGLTSIAIPVSVTSIGVRAFEGCSGLTSIEIHESVDLIGYAAFGGCTGLTSIEVSADNPIYRSENNCLIKKETNALIAGCKTSIIPDSVTYIDYAAFEGCSGLTSIAIPASVTFIGYAAFSRCSRLKDIYFRGTKAQWDAVWGSGHEGSAKNCVVHCADGERCIDCDRDA